ncbi:MAG: protein-L-isoaspartate(D-aspartate) O-methyltransferase [Chloroflexi bacterium]|nr:protein-L-isoaspartate(D-aspartate) O-methyltransferase [Chloroflexota bacterium]MCI0809414.1 protein-L-isoaspartate(D-aspartate) O-methyltransferase [Chloroflexota bacterium]MCI0871341.1 protein-L-isoaspartate(D-aspartate) O-methyltransferase [Chloroflexota bacterium]TDI89181.1 MAG: protein-L-isoaspartate(D-aspartate) O-methyltransferase [Chloroflexota bacterium]
MVRVMWLPGSTLCVIAIAIIAASACTSTQRPDSTDVERFIASRAQMVERDISDRGVEDPLVLSAMLAVPREEFVPNDYRDQAYNDYPLPIGEGQTISQPFIVALMTELLNVEPGDKILEIGTGSGYQAAVLAEMGADVYSIEIIPELAERARGALASTGYEVQQRVGDGYFGWEEHAPYDGIIVTAAPDHVPASLRDQLGPKGKMVIPVGPTGGVQSLWLIEQRDGQWVSLNQGAVRFVPFVRGQ